MQCDRCLSTDVIKFDRSDGHLLSSSSSSSSSTFSSQSPQLQSLDTTSNSTRSLPLCQTRFPMNISTNLYRRTILPIFPQANDNNEFYPLLANLADKHLSDEERILRTTNRYVNRVIETPTSCDPDSGNQLRDLFNLYAQKWQIDQNVLIINFNRLITIIPQLTLDDYVRQRQTIKPYALSIKEWFIALEFYLQMDIQCFFMKTCLSEGILARTAPSSIYGMHRCRQESCRFCYERLDLSKRFEPAMYFTSQQCHRFVNEYQIYLNSDVTCTSSNIIYTLTCPCHQYDFIGRCQVAFRDRMWQHRMNGCRLMSYFFFGQTIVDRLQEEHEFDRRISLAHIQLYQHSITCPTVLQLFLKCQPTYWCFVPMTIEQAKIDDLNMTTDEEYILTNYLEKEYLENTTTDKQSSFLRPIALVRWCVEHVPSPSKLLNYQFSRRQKAEQFDFFLNRIDLYPTRFLDLYNATIVMALPENASNGLRHLIQALLVAHAEPKLNIMTQSTISNNHTLVNITSSSSNPNWCKSLLHPRFSLNFTRTTNEKI